ncbi:MAG: TolC family protein [Planctomycetota bacterium]|nr:TolC family protein [Planctomycetota bacterium]
MRTYRQIALHLTAVLSAVCIACGLGCTTRPNGFQLHQPASLDQTFETAISYPDVTSVADLDEPIHPPVLPTQDEPISLWHLSLEEAVALALQHSDVAKDVGGYVLRAPRQIATAADPAIRSTNPRTGVEAALSAFDTLLQATANFENNNRPINNRIVSATDGSSEPLGFQQHLAQMNLGLLKTAATGTELRLQQTLNYDSNNDNDTHFDSYWETYLDAEFRHPLLRRGGTQYNRVFGPQGSASQPRGVLLARIDTDISIADFEIGIRNLISDVENVYWELYYSYRNHQILENATRAAILQRDIFAEMAKREVAGGQENIDRVNEEVSRLQIELLNSTWGVAQPQQQNLIFIGSGGIHLWERRLRRLMGIPINDGQLIYPSESPADALVKYDWEELQRHALQFRSELRRQKWNVKRTELVLVAAKNFQLPELDLVARYRWRGYGDHLGGPGVTSRAYNSAFNTLSTGDFQEWLMGFEFSAPLGFRRGSVTVRNAELRLQREKKILRDQEHAIMTDLSAGYAELLRSYQVLSYTRLRSESVNRDFARVEQELQRATKDSAPLRVRLLDTLRRRTESAFQHERALCEYNVALKNLHLHKGSLLEYCGVQLAESPWSEEAYQSAAERATTRHRVPGDPRHWNTPDPLELESR